MDFARLLNMLNAVIAKKKKYFITNTIMIDVVNISHKEVPEDFCVVRIIETNSYIHYKDGFLYFVSRMNGCLAVQKETANYLIEIMNNIFESKKEKPKLEIINFHDAYKEHGIVERQICYN